MILNARTERRARRAARAGGRGGGECTGSDGGEWRASDGEWRTADREWRASDGEWRASDGEWRTSDGEWRGSGDGSTLDAMRTQLRSAVAAAALVTALPLLLALGGGPPFHNDAMKVRGFDPPLGWEPLPPGSYPRLLAVWEPKDGLGRLTLVADKTAPGTTARALVDESRPALVRQGFRGITVTTPRPAGDDSDRAQLDATTDGGRRFVRQLYVVKDGIGYVLTLVGPMVAAAQMRRDFDEAVPSLSVGDAGRAAEPAPRR